MADRPLRRIKSVASKAGYRLTVQWDRGSTSMIDLSPTISLGGVFSELSENSVFSKVRVGETQRTIEWPKPVDEDGYPVIVIDADALYRMAEEQEVSGLARNMRKIIESAVTIFRATSNSKNINNKT